MQNTPLQSFISHKSETGMQCGNYSVELPKLGMGEQYRFHFNATACVGCHCCEAACNEQNGNSAEVKWRRVGEMEGGKFPETLQFFNSMSCNHCIDPACLNGCPTSSYIKLENGIVYHEDETCIGCQYCTWNCPYQVPVFNADRGIVTKCHMCHEKLFMGQTPACVQACPAGAIEIEVVNKDEWIRVDMAKSGTAPHLPDINITKPTTRYTLPNDTNNLRPADERLLKPAHAEFPLVFMTVLTQVSFGGFVAILLGEIFSSIGFELATPSIWMILAVFVPVAVGLPLSALHLGRPLLAITAMKNITTSWLSREALFLGIYALLLNILFVLFLFELPKGLILGTMFLTLLVGFCGIYAQSMIYRVPARPSWNKDTTTHKFFGTGYIGFLLVAFVLLVQKESDSAVSVLSLGMLFGLAHSYTVLKDRLSYENILPSQSNFYQLNRTKELYSGFASLSKFTIGFTTLCGVIFPLFAVVLLGANLVDIATSIVGLCVICGLIAEFVGRYLFFVTVVPTGLAGNFFAGSQR